MLLAKGCGLEGDGHIKQSQSPSSVTSLCSPVMSSLQCIWKNGQTCFYEILRKTAVKTITTTEITHIPIMSLLKLTAMILKNVS